MKHSNSYSRNICRAGLYLALGSTVLLRPAAVLSAPEQPPVQKETVSQVERVTVLIDILINKRSIPRSGWNSLLLSKEDTISFSYVCSVSGGEKVPLLFNTKLAGKNLKQERQQAFNSTKITFAGLQEDEYTFTVQAFAPGNNWKASPETISFRVNNAQAWQRKQEEADKATADSSVRFRKSADTNAATITQPTDNNRMGQGMLIAAGLLLSGAAGFYFFRRRKQNTGSEFQLDQKPRQEPLSSTPQQDNVDMTGQEMYKNDQSLLAENAQLRQEIEALRAQLASMQQRSDQLTRQNKELEITIEKVTQKHKELEELQKQKEELFAMVIHDIKNPAGLIKGLVELLRSYDLTASEQNEIMNDLMETSKRIVHLSQEVCKIIALESGKLNLNVLQADISEIVNSVFRRNEAAAKNKTIQMALDMPAQLPQTLLDADKIEEVLDNLVSNAIKFSHPGGAVRIRAKKEMDSLVVEVSDNGQGLSEEDMKKAFTKGARLSARPTSNEPSSGLGLWIVKRIVEEHKGSVWVRSALGKGSTFAFRLPITK
jgi:LPXTG-motif cell wall-anchored protein